MLENLHKKAKSNQEAACALAKLYCQGKDVDQNYQQAIYWLLTSAALGNEQLKQLFKENITYKVTIDSPHPSVHLDTLGVEAAKKWLGDVDTPIALQSLLDHINLSIQQEETPRFLCFELGKFFNYTINDHQQAVKWYLKSMQQGYTMADYFLFVIIFEVIEQYYQQGEYDSAMNWCQQYAELGNADAQYQLGMMYQDANNPMANTDKAFHWIEKSATNTTCKVSTQKKAANYQLILFSLSEDQKKYIKSIQHLLTKETTLSEEGKQKIVSYYQELGSRKKALSIFDGLRYSGISQTQYNKARDLLKQVFPTPVSPKETIEALLKRSIDSADLPSTLAELKNNHLACSANKTLKIIHVRIFKEVEETYQQALAFLNTLLAHGFSDSFSFYFDAPKKNVFPIDDLQQSGPHHFFANVTAYPRLCIHIYRYAKLAMKRWAWYLNPQLQEQHNCMPSTFAVYCLLFMDQEQMDKVWQQHNKHPFSESYQRLLHDYIYLADTEHQYVHWKFTAPFLQRYGAFEQLDYYCSVLTGTQIHEHNPVFTTMFGTKEGLELLLHERSRIKKTYGSYSWWHILITTFDVYYEDKKTIVNAAPIDLQPLYKKLFRGWDQR